MKNFETLEVGRSYRARNGHVVNIKAPNDSVIYPFRGDDGSIYTKEGHYICTDPSDNRSLIELIEEPTASPIRKIRRFPSGAIRSDNTGRPRPDFISPYALQVLGRFLAGTENSFAQTNYYLGIPIEACYESLCRHQLEVGVLLDQGVTGEPLEKAIAALTFNGIAMLTTLEKQRLGLYKEIHEKTELVNEDTIS